MVCSCSVHLCTNRSKPGPRKIHFFSFPLKNAERNQQWVNAVGRKGFIPTKHSKVCSDHFHQNDFEKKCGGSYLLKLKGTAVPSIFPNYSDIISKAKKQCLEVEQFQVAGPSSYIPCTETNEPEEIHYDVYCVMDDDNTSVKIISPLESTSNIQECNLLTQNSSPPTPLLITPSKVSCVRSLFNISLPKRPRLSPSKSELKKKIKSLQQQIRQQDKSIKNLKDLLKVLKKKNLIERETEELLMEKFDGTALDIFQNVVKNKGKKSTGCRFSKKIKEFSLTLHYYSPKAYEYARSVLILPSSKSIMNWTSSINAEPGIFSEVMESLKTLSSEDKHCNLCLDTMAVRKQILWSDNFNKFIGYCD